MRGGELLLLPVYTLFMDPAEYGRWALASGAYLVLRPVVSLGLQGGLLRYFFHFEGDARSRFLSAMFVTSLLVTGLVATLCILTLSAWGPEEILGLTVQPTLQLVIIAATTGVLFLELPREALRAMGRGEAMAAGSVLALLVQGMLVVFLCGRLDMGVAGALFALMAGHVTNGLGVLALLRPRIRRPSFVGIAAVLLYSLPLVPHILAHWTLSFSDRFFISGFGTLEDVAIYNAGYLLGTVLALPKAAFTSALVPYYGEVDSPSDSAQGDVLAKMTSLYAFGILSSAVLVATWLPFAGELVLEGSYPGAVTIASVVLAGSLTFAFYNPSANIITLVAGQSGRLGILTGCAALINILLNAILVPSLGMMGAAISTVATYLFLAVSAFVVARRYWDIPYDFKSIGLGCGLFLVTLVVVNVVPVSMTVLYLGVPIAISGLSILLLHSVLQPPFHMLRERR